ncbi:MAG: hypothetical protein LBR26_05090 [Prevotella sp.]|jgi:hypothetical protein|nr:hypothetical protein [Prevotella sp.]
MIYYLVIMMTTSILFGDDSRYATVSKANKNTTIAAFSDVPQGNYDFKRFLTVSTSDNTYMKKVYRVQGDMSTLWQLVVNCDLINLNQTYTLSEPQQSIHYDGSHNPNATCKTYQPVFSGLAGPIGGTGNTNADYDWTVTAGEHEVKPLILQNVVFNGTNSYHEDPIYDTDASPIYQAGGLVSPQDWLKNRTKNPAIFYSSNSNPTVDVILNGVMASGMKLSLKGTGPDGILAQCNNVTPNTSDNTVTVTGIQLTGLTGNGVKYYENMSLSWQASINGGTWFDVGNSDNEMYVSLKKPTFNPVVTEVHISVTNAVGLNAEATVRNILINYFSGRSVKKKDGGSLAYYITGGGGQGKYGLIYVGHSKCNAWVDLFIGVLGCHGISSSRAILETSNRNEFMKIKTYSFQEPPSGTGQYPYKIALVAKLPGQSNPNPVIDYFQNHYIVEVSQDVYFDPSYGIRYNTNRVGLLNNAFINVSVSAFGIADGFQIDDFRKRRDDGNEIRFR